MKSGLPEYISLASYISVIGKKVGIKLVSFLEKDTLKRNIRRLIYKY